MFLYNEIFSIVWSRDQIIDSFFRVYKCVFFTFKIQTRKICVVSCTAKLWSNTHTRRYAHTNIYTHMSGYSRYKRQIEASHAWVFFFLFSWYTHIGFWTTFIFKNFSYSKNEQINAEAAASSPIQMKWRALKYPFCILLLDCKTWLL